MKKKIAVFMAFALLCAGAVTGCKKDEQNGGNTDVTETPSGIVESVDDTKLPSVERTEYDDTMIVKVGDTEYSAATYRWITGQSISAFGTTDPSVWETGTTEQLKIWEAMAIVCKEYGVSLDETDYQSIEQMRTQIIESYAGDIEQYKATLASLDMTDATFVEYITRDVLFQKFVEKFSQEYEYDNQVLLDYVNEEYVRVKHILIKTTGFDDAQKAEARSRADRVLERALAGESFEALVEEISEDGMDVEKGYYFTYGTMVQPFEDASYALEVGEISDIVESEFGYHIIKKYPMLEEDILADTEIMTAVKSYVCYDAYSKLLYEKAESLEVVPLENYDEIRGEIIDAFLADVTGTTDTTATQPESETAEPEVSADEEAPENDSEAAAA